MDRTFHESFIALMNEQVGDETEALLDALRQEPAVSVRFNPKKRGLVPEGLLMEGARVAWCEDGIYLDKRPQFTLDPLLHGGAYYVQEASSMFLHYAVRQLAGERAICALDACAAPGGKSTLLHGALPPGSLVVSNEYVRNRAHVLAENIAKWGYANSVVTNNGVEDFVRDKGAFDLVVVDAPCSGEGMFRKEPEALRQWSLDNVEMCVARQRQIVENAVCALKEGGLFVYSTCTFNRREDEELGAYIERELGLEEVTLDLPEEWGIVRGERGYHFYPHRTKGEGLYMSFYRKEGTEGREGKRKEGKRKGEKGQLREIGKIWLKNDEDYEIEEVEGRIVAFAKTHADLMRRIAFGKNALMAGVELGVMKGNKFVPSAALALSETLSENVGRVDVDKETALRYLRRETIDLSGKAEKGYVVVQYQGLPIGWVKNLGNRSNNLYPEYWRIRKL